MAAKKKRDSDTSHSRTTQVSGPLQWKGPASCAVSSAVAHWLKTYPPAQLDHIYVALSGGPDSLALTAGALCQGIKVTCLIVDHQLQVSSDVVARETAQQVERLGAAARILPVTVSGDHGLEGSARQARYAALEKASAGENILVGHTMDDQAETVLLGLVRGSGLRSLQAMAPVRGTIGRPLLDLRRAQTMTACTEWGLKPYNDPHNSDPRFTRVRVRTEVLPSLTAALGDSVVLGLARSARLAREDNEILEHLTEQQLSEIAVGPNALDIALLAGLARGLRTRVVKHWLLVAGFEVGFDVIAAIDDLVVNYHGQGAIAVGGTQDQSGQLIRSEVQRVKRAGGNYLELTGVN